MIQTYCRSLIIYNNIHRYIGNDVYIIAILFYNTLVVSLPSLKCINNNRKSILNKTLLNIYSSSYSFSYLKLNSITINGPEVI